MATFPLLVVASPQVFSTRHGPKVRVDKGTWVVETKDDCDVELVVHEPTDTYLRAGSQYMFTTPTVVSAIVTRVGKAQDVTVFIRRISGLNS